MLCFRWGRKLSTHLAFYDAMGRGDHNVIFVICSSARRLGIWLCVVGGDPGHPGCLQPLPAYIHQLSLSSESPHDGN